MEIPEPTRREKAAAGNGPLEEYVEYEAEVNRDPAEYRGRGDSDPKYDMTNNYATIEDIFCNQLERAFDDIKKDRNTTSDTPDSQDDATGTSF